MRWLTGSMLILMGRVIWIASTTLTLSLTLAIVVHRLWALPGPEAQPAMFFALEHISLMGGHISAAIASHWRHTARLASQYKFNSDIGICYATLTLSY